jgi:hypothetical protein
LTRGTSLYRPPRGLLPVAQWAKPGPHGRRGRQWGEKEATYADGGHSRQTRREAGDWPHASVGGQRYGPDWVGVGTVVVWVGGTDK